MKSSVLKKTSLKTKRSFLFLRKNVNFFGSFAFLLSMIFLLSFIIRNDNLVVQPSEDKKKISDFKELLGTPALYPVNKGLSTLPYSSAKSAILVDVDSLATLYEKEADLRVFPASTTKIMTALVSLDNYRMDQILEVKRSGIDGSTLKLKQGEEFTADSLLYALLVASANDAAEVLADNFPGGYSAFVMAMNEKGEQLNLKNTHFTNPAGYDEEGHFTTARDLSKLALYAIKNKEIVRIVSTPALEITDAPGVMMYKLRNTNELVGEVEGVMGIKTGWTENAGECLVSLVERDGKKEIIVILGSENRFGDTKELIKWVYSNFAWQVILPSSRLQ